MELLELERYMQDLEDRIDPAQEDRILGEWLAFADKKLGRGFFAPSRTPAAPKIPWPHMLVNEGLESERNMIYQQLQAASRTLETGGGEVLCLRSNYGTGIIPTMYGAEMFVMPDDTDTLPGSRPFPNGGEDVRALLRHPAPDYTKGLAARVFSMAETYLEIARKFPKISRYVQYYNPDLQGPLALCETLWGSSFYLDFYDDTELLEAALDAFADIYLDFTARWHALCPTFDAEHSVEWGCLHRGGTIIRNDSAMNISGDAYEEFVMPRDQKILAAVGGGVHFCGKGDHYVSHLAEIRGLSCINMSEPARNNMETIYRNTVDRGILIFGMRSSEVERAAAAGRELHGLVHKGASVAAWVSEKEK